MPRSSTTIATTSARETQALGKLLARRLRGGEVIALFGELGAGKTTLVKGIAAGLGIKRSITSPTFVLIRVYPVHGHRTIKHFAHVDAYRIKHPAELNDVGLGEYLRRPDTITVIEWADKIPHLLPRQRISIRLNVGRNPNHRTIRQGLLAHQR